MELKNKKAYHNFEILKIFQAGIVLLGTEIKSVKDSKCNFSDSFCYFQENKLILKNFHIAEYELGTCNNHEPLRDKVLLLHKRELKDLKENISIKGLTIIPLKVYTTEKGLAKVEIAIARGKKLYDKRETIKSRDAEREMKRAELL